MHYACSYVCQARAQLKCTQGQFSIVLCSSKLVDWTVAEPRSIACIHDCFHQQHQRFSIMDGNKNMPWPWRLLDVILSFSWHFPWMLVAQNVVACLETTDFGVFR